LFDDFSYLMTFLDECCNEIFGNDHPIHIEIGMGKGRFLHTLAKSNPQIN